MFDVLGHTRRFERAGSCSKPSLAEGLVIRAAICGLVLPPRRRQDALALDQAIIVRLGCRGPLADLLEVFDRAGDGRG